MEHNKELSEENEADLDDVTVNNNIHFGHKDEENQLKVKRIIKKVKKKKRQIEPSNKYEES
jgi:hypothetical protein